MVITSVALGNIHPGRPADIGLHWARPAILVAGKDRAEMFFSFSSLSLVFLFIPCPSLSAPLLSFLSLFSLSLGDKMINKG